MVQKKQTIKESFTPIMSKDEYSSYLKQIEHVYHYNKCLLGT